MGFDIALHNFSEAAEQGYTFNLHFPNGDDSKAKLTILGDMSPTVENYNKKTYKDWNRQTKVAEGKNKKYEPELEDFEDMSLKSALVRLIGWEGMTENGKVVPFSKEKATEFLTIHKWVRQTIMSEAAEVANFTPKTLKD